MKKLNLRFFIEDEVIIDLFEGIKSEVEYYTFITLIYYKVIYKNGFVLPTINIDCYSSIHPSFLIDYSVIMIIFISEIITDLVSDFIATN